MIKVALLVLIVIIAVVVWGPAVLGFHQGYGGFVDALSGEHCIRWFGSVWCRS